MNNFVTSQIRTYAPILIGGLISWLALKGIALDTETQSGLVIAFTGLLQAVYYFLARLLERKFPQLGFLLGSAKTPVYVAEPK